MPTHKGALTLKKPDTVLAKALQKTELSHDNGVMDSDGDEADVFAIPVLWKTSKWLDQVTKEASTSLFAQGVQGEGNRWEFPPFFSPFHRFCDSRCFATQLTWRCSGA